MCLGGGCVTGSGGKDGRMVRKWREMGSWGEGGDEGKGVEVRWRKGDAEKRWEKKER